jgi:hypothetical protein
MIIGRLINRNSRTLAHATLDTSALLGEDLAATPETAKTARHGRNRWRLLQIG